VIARIGRLRHAQEHDRKRLTVDGDAQVLGVFGAFDLDHQLADVWLDLLALFFCSGLSVAERLRRVRRQLLLDDLQVRLTRFDELSKLGVSARHEQQMGRRMHQRFCLGEQVDRVFEATFVEGLRALGGKRAGAGPLLVALCQGWASAAEQACTQQSRGEQRTRPKQSPTHANFIHYHADFFAPQHLAIALAQLAGASLSVSPSASPWAHFGFVGPFRREA
jgi:hypothetical protein